MQRQLLWNLAVLHTCMRITNQEGEVWPKHAHADLRKTGEKGREGKGRQKREG